jgi:hypothetical protein
VTPALDRRGPLLDSAEVPSRLPADCPTRHFSPLHVVELRGRTGALCALRGRQPPGGEPDQRRGQCARPQRAGRHGRIARSYRHDRSARHRDRPCGAARPSRWLLNHAGGRGAVAAPPLTSRSANADLSEVTLINTASTTGTPMSATPRKTTAATSTASASRTGPGRAGQSCACLPAGRDPDSRTNSRTPAPA